LKTAKRAISARFFIALMVQQLRGRGVTKISSSTHTPLCHGRAVSATVATTAAMLR
jgi:hypothetical protein